MSKPEIGVLLINLGTPDAPTTGKVRTYLSEFLNDERVIDLPWLARKILVNLVIVPFRASKSAHEYKKLWTKEGSPLLFHTKEVTEKLQIELGDNYKVEMAMRYQNPGLDVVLARMQKANYKKIVILPLYPQYASASTGSTHQKVMEIMSKWWVIPSLSFVSQFHDHPGYINTIVERSKSFDLDSYDHILFSYHGLPVRQLDKVYDNDDLCEGHDCEKNITHDNKYCYKATCYHTTRLIAEKLNLAENRYTVAFQSRLNQKWIEPFSDKVIEEKAKQGCKKILVFSPAFTADCLETIVEIGGEYQGIMKEFGREKIDLVPSLNNHPLWVKTLKDITISNS